MFGNICYSFCVLTVSVIILSFPVRKILLVLKNDPRSIDPYYNNRSCYIPNRINLITRLSTFFILTYILGTVSIEKLTMVKVETGQYVFYVLAMGILFSTAVLNLTKYQFYSLFLNSLKDRPAIYRVKELSFDNIYLTIFFGILLTLVTVSLFQNPSIPALVIIILISGYTWRLLTRKTLIIDEENKEINIKTVLGKNSYPISEIKNYELSRISSPLYSIIKLTLVNSKNEKIHAGVHFDVELGALSVATKILENNRIVGV